MNICLNTKFLFVVTSTTVVEDRFLSDIDDFIRIILTKGVNLSDIIVATDAQQNMVLAKFPVMRGAVFITSSQLLNVINTIECENLIILTDCHGSIYGIDAQSSILPHPLTEAIKNNHSLKNVIAFFGQCYAGIYNWVDLRKENKNIVYLGATEFNSSLSCVLPGKSWHANISLAAFGQWLKKPIDIDGDGLFTVMDLYKYILYCTNSITDAIEKRQTADLVDAKVDLKLAMKDKEDSTDEMMQLEKEAIEVLGNYIVPHQNPWLLNAFSAQNIQFE